MGFSLTILALLARLRVLVQQILLDVVSVFNMVSSLSQEKHSIKITQEGLEVFREYYPPNKEFVSLKCMWEMDKFVLDEKTHKRDVKGQDGGLDDGSVGKSAPHYWSLESFLGDSDSDLEKADEDQTARESSTHIKEDTKYLFPGPSVQFEHGKQVEGGIELEDNPIISESPGKQLPLKDSLAATSSSPPSSKFSRPESGSRQVAFVSVKRPAPSTAAFISVKKPTTSTASIEDPRFKEMEDNSNKNDSFFNLLTGDNLKDSLF